MSDCFFFFNDTATTEIYTLSLHDALPTCSRGSRGRSTSPSGESWCTSSRRSCSRTRSEEHTSELQSPCNLVCRLLLEKKNTIELGLDRRQTKLFSSLERLGS